MKRILSILGRYRRNFTLAAASTTRYKARRNSDSSGSYIRLGDHCIFEGRIVCEREGARVTIGARSFVGNSYIVGASNVSIGEDVLISWGVTIMDHDSHTADFDNRRNDMYDPDLNFKRPIHPIRRSRLDRCCFRSSPCCRRFPNMTSDQSNATVRRCLQELY